MLDRYNNVCADAKGLSGRNEEYNKAKFGITSKQYMRIKKVIEHTKLDPKKVSAELINKTIMEMLISEQLEL